MKRTKDAVQAELTAHEEDRQRGAVPYRERIAVLEALPSPTEAESDELKALGEDLKRFLAGSDDRSTELAEELARS